MQRTKRDRYRTKMYDHVDEKRRVVLLLVEDVTSILDTVHRLGSLKTQHFRD
jgi:hypothetical protein